MSKRLREEILSRIIRRVFVDYTRRESWYTCYTWNLPLGNRSRSHAETDPEPEQELHKCDRRWRLKRVAILSIWLRSSRRRECVRDEIKTVSHHVRQSPPTP